MAVLERASLDPADYLPGAMRLTIEAGDGIGKVYALISVTGQQGGKWVDDAVKQGQKYGISQDIIKNSLAQMVRSLGNTAQARQGLQVAEDIAQATGKPLADVVLAVTKGYEGQIKPLKQLGIDLPIAAGGALKVQKAQEALDKANQNLLVAQEKVRLGHLKGLAALSVLGPAQDKVAAAQDNLNTLQSTGAEIVFDLSKTYGGSASDASATLEGKVKSLHAWFTNLQENIGQKVIPKILELTQWMGKHKEIVELVAGVIGTVLVVAFVAWAASAAAAAVATVAAAAPILALVAVIALVAYAAYDLYKHWDIVWAALKKGVGIIVSQIKAYFQDFLDFVTSIPDTIMMYFGKLVGLGANIGKGIVNGIIGAINQAIGFIDSFQIHVHLKIPVPGVPDINFDWNGLGIPQIPKLHSGGLFNSGMGQGLALLQDGETVMTPEQMQDRRGGGGTTIVHFPAGAAPAAVALARTRYDKRNGRFSANPLDNSRTAMGVG